MYVFDDALVFVNPPLAVSVLDGFGQLASKLKAAKLPTVHGEGAATRLAAEYVNDHKFADIIASSRQFGAADGGTTAPDGSQESPGQILFDNPTACLSVHIPGVSQGDMTAVADALIFHNQMLMVQSQSTLSSAQAALWLQSHGLNFDASSWVAWYSHSARGVPPSN